MITIIIVKTLIDPDRATGLKVVVSSKEITDSDLEQQELDKFIEAAGYKIARYADISLLVVALDTGEYLGSLHRTDDPIDLAIAIPSDVIALDAPVYVLRLHNGVVERLATTVRDGLACFASDLSERTLCGAQGSFLRQFPLLIENRRDVCYIYMYISTGILCLLSRQTRGKNYAKEAICLGKSEHKPGSMSSF